MTKPVPGKAQERLEILKWACEQVQEELHENYASDLWKKEKGMQLFEQICDRLPKGTGREPAEAEGRP
jgi:hypothetical protein